MHQCCADQDRPSPALAEPTVSGKDGTRPSRAVAGNWGHQGPRGRAGLSWAWGGAGGRGRKGTGTCAVPGGGAPTTPIKGQLTTPRCTADKGPGQTANLCHPSSPLSSCTAPPRAWVSPREELDRAEGTPCAGAERACHVPGRGERGMSSRSGGLERLPPAPQPQPRSPGAVGLGPCPVG